MSEIDKLLNSFLSTACLLDIHLNFDSGQRDHNPYIFVFEDDWNHFLQDSETEIIHESDLFCIASSPNYDYHVILNKTKIPC